MRPIYFITLTVFLLISQIADACDPNFYSYDILNQQTWAEIQQAMKNTSVTVNKKPVSKYTIMAIIGFPGECSSSANGIIEECTWIDGQNCKKKIYAKFRNDDIAIIRKSGF